MLSDSEKNKLKELGFDLVGMDEVIQSFAGEAHQEPVPRGEKTTSEPRMNLDDMLKACTDKDHWKVGQDMIFRVHMMPRRHMYEPVPHDFPGNLKEIGYTRETHRFFEDGLHDVVHDEWGMIPEASEMTNLAWTGFSLFRKRSDSPLDLSDMPKPPQDTPEYRAFIAERFGPGMEQQAGKKPRKMNYHKCEDHVKEGINGARKDEWEKYKRYNAAIPIQGEMLQKLLNEGHKPIPSQWIDVDKHEHQKGSEGYEPKYRSRLVACGHLEHVDKNELRCDSPTADAEIHCLIASYAASRKLKLMCADISSAYFQASPLERVLLMRQPSGGLPGVPENAMLLCRLPIYGTMDAGRGFYNRLCTEAKTEGLEVSKIAPGLYYLVGSDGLPAIILATHVDDLLWCATQEGSDTMERILAKFDVGKIEHTDFRFCGRRFKQAKDFSVHIDAEDNTRQIRKIIIPGNRKTTDRATETEVTSLRSVVGSLAWVARFARPDLCYRVNSLQRACATATVADLKEANRVVDLAQVDQERALYFPAGMLDWHDICIVTFSDASFAQESGFRSQQGRLHYLTTESKADENRHIAHVISYGSTTIKRVCRSTLASETYAMQTAVESGDRLRAIICELRGQLPNLKGWHEETQKKMRHLWVTDCRSLSDHLNSQQINKVADKRLMIELMAMRQQLWENDIESFRLHSPHGDKLRWTDTATQVADALTKSMKPFQLFKLMEEACVQLSSPSVKLTKGEALEMQ